MIRNYFKTAWRSLRKNKTSSIINIGGLAVGMIVAILIGLWIYDELSFDRTFKNYDRIARVMQHQRSNGIVSSAQAMPYPIGKELQTTYHDNFDEVVMASWQRDDVLSFRDKIVYQHGIYMDVGAPAMLHLTMIKGSYRSLDDPHSIILSQSATTALFGEADPINQPIRIDNKLDVKVTGVYDDIPINTSFGGVNYISTWELYTISENWIREARDEPQWDNNSFQAFAQIAPNTTFERVNKIIANSKLAHVNPEDKKYNANVYLHPMNQWHLRSHWDENGVQTGGAMQYVWLFALVGVFVLLLACINFMNLSTARSEKRAKEVGIRKTVGSQRKHLIIQFYCESLLIVLFAFAVALMASFLLLPWFNEIAAKHISMPWANAYFWFIAVIFIAITSLLAGSYPALYLSSFRPIKVLKGTFKTSRLASIPRQILVVVQFTVSLVLIISTIIIYNQIQYSKDRPIGYDRNGLMMIAMRSPDFYGKFGVMETELKNSGAVTEFAESSSPITEVWSSNNGFSWQGKDPNLDAEFATIWVTHDFGRTVKWQFESGRDFSKAFPTDSQSVVINTTLANFMHVKDPPGMSLRRNDKDYRIIGVIKDMLMESPYEPVQPTVYYMDYDNVNWIDLKLNPNRSASSSIAKIASIFRKLVPTAPFDYKFADLQFAAKFAAEERIGTLASFFAGLAIFISCLGLFGLASFVAEKRTKEIGLRKVLGASVMTLWNLLSKEFVVLVVISFLLAVPAAYYSMHSWLLNYPYRTKIYWWVFAMSGVSAMVITLSTVSYHSIKAARANPVKSLRTE